MPKNKKRRAEVTRWEEDKLLPWQRTTRQTDVGEKGGDQFRQNISPDSAGGWRCVSSAGTRSPGWSAGGTGDPRAPRHWGCAAPACLWGWRTCSSSRVVAWRSHNFRTTGETWKERVKVLVLCKSNFDENRRISSTQYGLSTVIWCFAIS